MIDDIEVVGMPTARGIVALQNLDRPQFDLRGHARQAIRDNPDHAAVRYDDSRFVWSGRCWRGLCGRRRAIDKLKHALNPALYPEREFAAALACGIGEAGVEPVAIPAGEVSRIARFDFGCGQAFEASEI